MHFSHMVEDCVRLSAGMHSTITVLAAFMLHGKRHQTQLKWFLEISKTLEIKK